MNMRISIKMTAIDQSIVVNNCIRFLAEPKRVFPYLDVVIGGALPRKSPILSIGARTSASDGGMKFLGCPVNEG